MRVKQIEKYPNYTINSLGQIKNKKFLKQEKTANGYLRVMLYNSKGSFRYSVHRLVALAFIPNPENKPQVNHINGIKTDNRIENLEWCTQSENQIHAIKSGLQKHCIGTQRGKVCKLTESIVSEIKNKLKLGASQVSLSKEYNVNQSNISRIKTNTQWGHA